MSALALPRHSLVLAKRNLIGVMRNPEALLDVTLQPMIFIALFTYIFGGAIADGSQQDYLQFLLPGVLAQIDRLRRGGDRREPQHRHLKGRLRPLPQPPDLARGAAGRRRAGRHRALRAAVPSSRSASATSLGFRAHDRARSRCSPRSRS